MALSQLQCLDNNHVNPRTHESKPEFFYCEDQRLALEALLRDGREAFFKYLEARGLRGFLSDPELDDLTGAVEPYDPGSELFSGDTEDEQTPLSLHYWPELSDTSIPQMDLGWPDSDAYRGVTRTTVYTQPPLDGRAHIKEVVRKLIAQAQKVIAVVMDVFTDVDIFRDLLDAGFKRRVSVYILLERATLPHFLAMCQRANMHAGHLKHLRVRCSEGAEFYTRSCTKVRGRMGHRFVFIDGDKAVSGSYSFTWMASRLDRNLITVVTGQAVDGFDRLFRFLYPSSSPVDLRQTVTEPEPEPEPLPQPAAVIPPSADIARKLYSPKYALVALTNPSPTTSANQESPKEPQNPENSKKKRRGKASEESTKESPPLHPGLINLEKACLIAYLPTWPDPDPPSDVIGFINIRDAKKPTQVHLQRSEMFETSQAIRFSIPFSNTKETKEEVAKPTQSTPKQEEVNALQPAQTKSKAEDAVDKEQQAQLSDVVRNEEASEQKSPASEQKPDLQSDAADSVSPRNKFHSSTTTNQDAGLDTALGAQTLPQSSSKAPASDEGKISHAEQHVSSNSHTGSGSLPELNTKREAEPTSSLNTQSSVVHGTHTTTLNGTHTPQIPDSPELNTEQDTKENTTPSQTRAVHKQPQISTEVASSIQTPTVHSNISTFPVSATQSKFNHIPITTVHSSTSPSASVPSTSSSSLPPLTSSVTASDPHLPASSSLTPAPPVPKPRTVRLVISDSSTSNGPKLPEIRLVRRPEASTGPLAAHSAFDVAAVEQTSLVKECQTVPELQDDSASKAGAQKDTENTGNPEETPKQESKVTSVEADERDDDGAGSQTVAGTELHKSNALINDAPKAAALKIREIIPKDVDLETSKDCAIIEKTDAHCVATTQADTASPERTLTGSESGDVSNKKGENVTQCRTFLARVHEPQRISFSKPQDTDQMEALNSPIVPLCSTSYLNTCKDSNGVGAHASAADTHNQQSEQGRLAHEYNAVSMPNTENQNTHSTFQEHASTGRVGTHTPEKALRLHLIETHLPDFRSQTPVQRSKSLTARAPTPDGFSPRVPDLDSRSPDVFDGYISSRENSTLSTTSEEYYECSDSPFNEPVFDHVASGGHGMIEDHISFAHKNTLNASAHRNYSSSDATLGTAHSETQTLTGRPKVPSSSLLRKKVETREVENKANGEEASEEDKPGIKLSVAERREEQESQGTEMSGSEETGGIMEHFKRGEDSTEARGKDKEVQMPTRKVERSQSAADRLVDGGMTAGGSSKERSKPKRSSTGDLKSIEGGRPDREGRDNTSNQMEVRPRGTERRASPQSNRNTEGQKLSQSSPKPQNKGVQHSVNFLDNVSSLRKTSTRPPQPLAAGPVGSTAGRKQVSQSQQSQDPAVDNQTFPNSSLLHMNPQIQLSPQTASGVEVQDGRTSFNLTFSRLHNLKSMKAKVNKTPAQSKRGGVAAPAQESKTSS